MKRVLMLVLLPVLVTGLALAAGASGASAATVVHVSGTDLGPDAGTTACQPANDSGTLLTCTTPDFATRYTGDLTGTISTNFYWTINCTSSRIAGYGIETFTGSVAGVGSGTLRWATKFHAAFECSTQTLSNLIGSATVMSGTGRLTGLHGRLTFLGQTYSGILTRHHPTRW
jgi:hypothetical protein